MLVLVTLLILVLSLSREVCDDDIPDPLANTRHVHLAVRNLPVPYPFEDDFDEVSLSFLGILRHQIQMPRPWALSQAWSCRWVTLVWPRPSRLGIHPFIPGRSSSCCLALVVIHLYLVDHHRVGIMPGRQKGYSVSDLAPNHHQDLSLSRECSAGWMFEVGPHES